MNEERSMILKMLKEGKISVEEADALLEALQENRGGEGKTKKAAEESRKDGEKLDFSGMGSELKSGFQEFARTMEGTIRQAVDSIKSLKLGSTMSEAFGRARGTDEKEIILSLDDITTVDLKTSSGDVIVTGDERDEILILAKITATGKDEESAAERAKGTEIEHEINDGTLTIRDSAMGMQITGPYSVDYQLTVPKSISLKVRVADGDISIRSIEGGSDVNTLSGDIRCEDCYNGLQVNSKSGDIRFSSCGGPTDARTLSGDVILAGMATNDLTCNTLSGDIQAEITSEDAEKIEARTLSGDVSVRLPATSKVAIKADTLSGEVHCNLPVRDVDKKGHRYNAILNEPDGRVILSTKSGDISIDDIS